MAFPAAPPLLLRTGDRDELVRLTRSSSVRAGLAQRARIVRELNTKIRAFINGWNQRKHPFVWTKTPAEILAGINRKTISAPSH